MQKIVVYYEDCVGKMNGLLKAGWKVVHLSQVRTSGGVMTTVVVEKG